jgi:hypothetical protein
MGGTEGETHHGIARRLLMRFASLTPSYKNNSWPRLLLADFGVFRS